MALKMKRSSLCGRKEKSARYANTGHTTAMTLQSISGADLNAHTTSRHDRLLSTVGSSELDSHATKQSCDVSEGRRVHVRCGRT